MNSQKFTSFLNTISSKPLLVLDASIPLQAYVPIKLSQDNLDLQEFDVASSSAWQDYITIYLQKHHAKVAYGGYAEVRNIYKRSKHFNNLDVDTERNIHLGVDLWLDAGSEIFTPLDAEVHSFKNNENFGDYGPTIILKHTIETVEFYTLYGHLSLESLVNLQIGQCFKAGDKIATLGDASVNGDYAPHLHFQIIRDIQDFYGDYPGVCSKKDLDKFLQNCPDPNLLLKL
ncbi:peptidoglycan DD-metalloendopeptidase family protein [Corallibacter sp.]|uniref:peptidoglycan DD-metalloendopeptidase family protein n=1 Tax=Corallibacter sp. TaxID=2038084 RepID=UPI003A8CD5E8